ncbi:hypothetical protein ACQGFI_27535 [Rhodococcus sp. 2.95]
MLVPFLQAILNFAYGSIDAGGVVIDGLVGIFERIGGCEMNSSDLGSVSALLPMMLTAFKSIITMPFALSVDFGLDVPFNPFK